MGEIGVGWYFSASHRDPVRQELHGHSYEVTAWFDDDMPVDAVDLQAGLRRVLADLDHATLPKKMGTMEALAHYIGNSLAGCIAVDVSRPVERLYARWRA